MGKPLLSDDLLQKLARGEEIETPYPGEDWSDQETKIIETASRQGDFAEDTLVIDNQDRLHMSRRIENAKRGRFQSKLNRILLVLFLLVLALLYAVFNI